MKKSEGKLLAVTEKYDQKLREYIMGIYIYLSAAIGLTGLVAMFAVYYQTVITLLYSITDNHIGMSPFEWIVALAPIGIALIFGSRLHKMSKLTVQILFLISFILLGLSLSSIF